MLIEKICEELGVKVGEPWLGSDGNYYTVNYNGLIDVYNKDTDTLHSDYIYWEDIFTGAVKPVWKPEKGGVFYILDLTDDDFYDVTTWSNSSLNHIWLKRGLVCKTKDEAIEKAKKMLEVI